MKDKIKFKSILNEVFVYLLIFLGAAILAFGVFNIHYQSKITEGGELGLELLLKHYLNISPAITSAVFDFIFFILGIIILKNKFAIKAVVGTLGYSIVYFVSEKIGYVLPNLSDKPIVATIVGAIFVGVGAGLVVRMGGASGGDDSLALIISKITKLPIGLCYFMFDFIIIVISMTYISLFKTICSFITAMISSFVIGLMQKIKIPGK